MEQKTTGSPLYRICYQDSTFMLEALLPFVPISLKLPLAIMIKWNEFQRMLSVFQSRELLSRYGLAEQEFTLQGLTKQLAGCPNPKLTESIAQMGQMMQMMQMMQAMQNTESTVTSGTNTTSSLDAAISDILKQYDSSNKNLSGNAATEENFMDSPLTTGDNFTTLSHATEDDFTTSPQATEDDFTTSPLTTEDNFTDSPQATGDNLAASSEPYVSTATDPLGDFDIDQFVKEIFS